MIVEGEEVKTVERLPYHQAGREARWVRRKRDGHEGAVVKDGGMWRWWAAKDRIGTRSRATGQKGGSE